MAPTLLNCGKYKLSLERPLIMGVLNVTPDSFSDGGQFLSSTAAIEQGFRLIEEGADLLDIGGESSRPGALPIMVEEELNRVMPILEKLVKTNIPVSIDTYKPEVMKMALAAGASLVNDIWALRQPGALEIIAQSDCGICLMHMQKNPTTMQFNPHYQDVVSDVFDFLQARVNTLLAHGIKSSRIVIDPGFGFGKSLEHNLALLSQLEHFNEMHMPLLVGLSRKSMIGALVGKTINDRIAGSIAAALVAVMKGAKILRVHDVAATKQALKVWLACHEPQFLK